MIQYRRIDIDNKENLIELIKIVLNHLERKEFFIPFTDEEIEAMFDSEKTIIYGAFENDKLVGTAQLYLQESYVENIKELIDLKDNKVVELGGYLVLPEYRNKGIMKALESILIDKAKEKGYEYIVITIHPDNIPSNKVAKSTGAKIVKTTNLGNYLRNIYLLNLK